MDELLADDAMVRLKEDKLVACLQEKLNGQSHPYTKYISEVDFFGHEPQQLPGLSKLGMNNEEWYFFYSREKLYKNGNVWKRKTKEGNWHETGDRKEKVTIAARRIFVFQIKRITTEWILHEFEIGEGSNIVLGVLKKKTVKIGKRSRAASNGELRDNLAPDPNYRPLISEIARSDYASMNNSVKRSKTSNEDDYNDNLPSLSEVDPACPEVHAQQELPPCHMQTWKGDYLRDYYSCDGRHSCADTVGDANDKAYLFEKTNQNLAPQQPVLNIPIEQGISIIDNSNNNFPPHGQNMPQHPSCGTTDNETPEDSSGEEKSGPLYKQPMFSPGQAYINYPFNSYNEFNPNDWQFLVSSDAGDEGQLKLGEPSYFHDYESCYDETASKLLNDTHITQSLGGDSDVHSLWVNDFPTTTAIGGLSSNSTYIHNQFSGDWM